MNKLKLILFLLLGVSVATVSCKKDSTGDDNGGNNGGDNNTSKTCYVNKASYDDGYTTVSYNADHLVSKFEDFDTLDNKQDEFVFTYDGTKLKKVESYDDAGNIDGKIEFHYASGSATPDSLTTFSNNNGSMEKDGNAALTFTNGKLTKIEYLFEIAGNMVVVSKDVFTYTGDNCTKVENYEFSMSTMQLESSGYTTYEFDDKKSFEYGIGIDYFMAILGARPANKNNITKETSYDKDGTQVDQDSYNYTLEYTENDYVSKQIKTNFTGDDTETEIYTYDCN